MGRAPHPLRPWGRTPPDLWGPSCPRSEGRTFAGPPLSSSASHKHSCPWAQGVHEHNVFMSRSLTQIRLRRPLPQVGSSVRPLGPSGHILVSSVAARKPERDEALSEKPRPATAPTQGWALPVTAQHPHTRRQSGQVGVRARPRDFDSPGKVSVLR